jgi:hypothetical protein
VLRAAGIFPATAPPTVRMFSSLFAGQLTVEQMIDRYDLACRHLASIADAMLSVLCPRSPLPVPPAAHHWSTGERGTWNPGVPCRPLLKGRRA